MTFVVNFVHVPGSVFRKGNTLYPDDAAYEFLDGGVLRITQPGDPGTSTFYATSQWEDVETKDGHEPGGPNSSKIPVADTVL